MKRQLLKRLAGVMVLVYLYICSASLQAADVISSDVQYRNGSYSVDLKMRLEAEQNKIQALLTDYEHLSDIDPGIRDSEIISQSKDSIRVKTIVEGCMSFFCISFTQVQDVVRDDQAIIVSIVPEQSDFESGISVWRVVPDSEAHVIVHFSSRLKPKFSLPPVLGPWLLQKQMKHRALKFVRNLELRATNQNTMANHLYE